MDSELEAWILSHLDDTPLSDLLQRARTHPGRPTSAHLDWQGMLQTAQEPWLRWLELALLNATPLTPWEKRIMPLLDRLYVLRRLSLFAGLPPQQLLSIAELSAEVELPPGTVVYQQGDPGDSFYVVLRGELRVKRAGEIVAKLQEDDCSGETAQLDTGPSTATVVTATDCELSILCSHAFHDLFETHPSIARGMLTILARRLAKKS